MLALLAQCLSAADDRKIIGLCAPAGKYDFFRLTIEQSGDLLTGPGNGLSGLVAVVVRAGGIAEFFFEKRQHGLNDFRVMGGGGVIVQVDGFFHRAS